MAAIVLLVRAGAGEGNSLPLAVSIEVLVNKLAAIVRVKSQEMEW